MSSSWRETRWRRGLSWACRAGAELRILERDPGDEPSPAPAPDLDEVALFFLQHHHLLRRLVGLLVGLPVVPDPAELAADGGGECPVGRRERAPCTEGAARSPLTARTAPWRTLRHARRPLPRSRREGCRSLPRDRASSGTWRSSPRRRRSGSASTPRRRSGGSSAACAATCSGERDNCAGVRPVFKLR